MVAAIKRNNVPVIYGFWPDEGHGPSKSENQISAGALTEVFLRQCLGGRAQEIGSAISDSSIQMVEKGDMPL